MSVENFSLDFFNLTDKVTIVPVAILALDKDTRLHWRKQEPIYSLFPIILFGKERQTLIEVQEGKLHFNQAELNDKGNIKEIVEDYNVYSKIDILSTMQVQFRRNSLT